MEDGGAAGIVLASGLSARFGASNKLLAELGGVPIVRRTVEAYLAAPLDQVLVVVGYEADAIKAALAALPVIPVENPEFAAGQSRALAAGVRALPAGAAAAVIGVADQPLLTPEIIRRLVEAWRDGASLVVPRYGGTRGNPVLFARTLFPELLLVTGDRGGRDVLERHRQEIVWVEVADTRFGCDVDTVEDLERLRRDRAAGG